jgi:ABC-2 type transport system ATP-binding protein
MMGPAIEVNGLEKSYALHGLTFSVPRGSICGFLGANGAGKTTTLRILMGFARAQGGEADVLGVTAGSTPDIFRKVAFVPEVKEAYPFARIGEMIKLTRGFYPDWDAALEARLLREFDLQPGKWCAKLSKGTRAKSLLLLALCRRAELLVLDEPTEGLDPIATEQTMRLLVEQVAERGVTVFFSTHQLSEVEQIADRVVMIHQGRCVLQGALDEIQQTHQRVRCVVESDTLKLPLAYAHWRREGRFLTGYSNEDPAELASKLEPCGVKLLEAQPATLKEVFFAQVGAAQ